MEPCATLPQDALPQLRVFGMSGGREGPMRVEAFSLIRELSTDIQRIETPRQGPETPWD